jgi:hypothetical protein
MELPSVEEYISRRAMEHGVKLNQVPGGVRGVDLYRFGKTRARLRFTINQNAGFCIEPEQNRLVNEQFVRRKSWVKNKS